MTLLTDDDVAAIRSKYQCGGGCDGDSCDRYYAPPMPDDIARLLEDRAALLHERDALRAEMDDAREELQHVLKDWNELKQAIGSLTNGGLIGHANALRAVRDALHELTDSGRWYSQQTMAAVVAERDALAKDAARYAIARRMSPQQWAHAWELNHRTGKPFDEIIDDPAPLCPKRGEKE